MAKSSFRRGVKRVVSGAVARLWRRPLRTPDEILASRPRRILVVRPHNQMGDMVCATPCFRAIREAYPQAEIALICAPINFDVVSHSPHLDKVLLFDKRACTRPGPLWAFIREMRAFGPDLAFILNSVSFSVTSAALTAVSGARLIVGCDSMPYGFDISRHAYSLVMPSFPEVEGHAVWRSV
jgi:ADP-heptose:LPS heptosyltransferase